MLASLSNFFKKHAHKKHRGETLVEILAAVFILALTTTGTTSLIINSGRTSYDIRRTFQARYLAREAFDVLKMIRDTNWIRFSEENCWDISFDAKSCAKQNPDIIVQQGSTLHFGLVTSTSQDLYMRLAEVVDNAGVDSFAACQNFDPLDKSPYAIYENKTDDPNNAYNGVMFGTDGVPPADSVPSFCRQITLSKVDADTIKANVTVAWKVGSQKRSETYSSYLMNY